MSAKKTGKLLSRSISIDNPNKIKIACVISEWHNEITESFYNGALNKFSQYGVLENNVDKVYVPGSFELIFATKNLINKDYHAIITMGCIIKGETNHFEFISSLASWSRAEIRACRKCSSIVCQKFLCVPRNFDLHRIMSIRSKNIYRKIELPFDLWIHLKSQNHGAVRFHKFPLDQIRYLVRLFHS